MNVFSVRTQRLFIAEVYAPNIGFNQLILTKNYIIVL